MRVQAAETTLSQLGGAEQPLDHEALVQARIDAEERVIKLSRELEGLKKVYGDVYQGILPPDVAKLNGQIKRQAEELERLNLLKVSLESSEGDLFKELEKLGSAWEMLGKQVESKVFDLHQMEEKVTKAVVEKARSENKYFATMREKEALEVEKKALVRAQEKGDKAVQDMSARVNEAEKTIVRPMEHSLSPPLILASAESITRGDPCGHQAEDRCAERKGPGDGVWRRDSSTTLESRE
jgi:E3 ubiquitin-protein ligase BRE1